MPFPPESAASGIGITDPFEVVWYRRTFSPPERGADERVLVHFGAVDFEATVWVDGTGVGAHRGGHTPFVVDVTDALAVDRDRHELVVRAVDELRSDQLRGKQTATFPYLVHYPPTSGIWQPVWVEVTGPAHLDDLWVVAEVDGSLSVTGRVVGEGAARLRVTVELGDGPVVLEGEVSAAGVAVVGAQLDGVRPWSPADPALSDLWAEVVGPEGRVLDAVTTHVGFRTVTVEGDDWYLNGAPLRPRLLLDQGYWPESFLAPPSEEALLVDLRFVRDAGFDGVRKHQKIEDPRFLWHADRMGVLVWEELPSPFGIARVAGALADDALAEWSEAVERDRSHPSVIAWVPFNESWGIQGVHRRPEHQATVRSFVARTRELDPSRPVIDNSGWGHVETDVVDVHDYDQDPQGLRQRWSGIEARNWDRGPPAGADDIVASFDLARWLAFAQVEDPAAIDPQVLLEMIPDMAVWADGCMPEPGRAGPLVLSELGGIGLAEGTVPDDRFDYIAAGDADDLLAGFAALTQAVESIPEMRGWCWTQLADTHQEINGLLTATRRPKVDPARLRAVLDQLPWGPPRPPGPPGGDAR